MKLSINILFNSKYCLLYIFIHTYTFIILSQSFQYYQDKIADQMCPQVTISRRSVQKQFWGLLTICSIPLLWTQFLASGPFRRGVSRQTLRGLVMALIPNLNLHQQYIFVRPTPYVCFEGHYTGCPKKRGAMKGTRIGLKTKGGIQEISFPMSTKKPFFVKKQVRKLR